MRLRYLVRFCLLSTGFGLTTWGLLSWQNVNFDVAHLWPMAGEASFHPVHVIILGLALIPPTLWEVFLLENRSDDEH